jgi:hypothetical protein
MAYSGRKYEKQGDRASLCYTSYFITVILLVDMLICARVCLRVVSPKFGENLEIF